MFVLAQMQGVETQGLDVPAKKVAASKYDTGGGEKTRLHYKYKKLLARQK